MRGLGKEWGVVLCITVWGCINVPCSGELLGSFTRTSRFYGYEYFAGIKPELAYSLSPTVHICPLFEDLVLTESDVGSTYWVTAGSGESDFSDFVSRLTNRINEMMILSVYAPSTSSGWVARENETFAESLKSISGISMTVDALSFDYSGVSGYVTDGFVSLRIEVYGEASYDDDSDGLPNAWEELHFGGKTNAHPEAVCSNGVNTLAEAYIAGLDPHDSASSFSVEIVGHSAVQWSAVSGRVYSVYWSTNLLEGFQPLETNIPCNRNSYTNSGAGGFYRIGVQLAD